MRPFTRPHYVRKTGRFSDTTIAVPLRSCISEAEEQIVRLANYGLASRTA
jgi:hypothetical protein